MDRDKLNRSASATQTNLPITRSELSPPPEKASILLVDDRPENLLAMEVVLEPLAQNLVRARSGREALRQIDEREYAVILLDVQMPDWDGFETAFRIREKSRSVQTPIIFLTAASTDEASLIRGYAEGAVDYIIKPFLPEVLRTKVRIFVELHRRMTECRAARAALRRVNNDLERRVREHLSSAAGQASTLLDLLPSPVWLLDTSLRLRYANRTLGEWLGSAPSDLQNRSVQEVLGPRFAEAARPAAGAALAGRASRFDALLPCAGQEPRRVLVDYIPRLDKAGSVTGIAATAFDLTGL